MNDLDSTHASFYRPSRIGTVLVANRGEIAVRVIRAAHELGMRAVAAVSDADRDSLAARMADEAVHIGPSHAAKSYLDPAAMLAAARRSPRSPTESRSPDESRRRRIAARRRA